MVTRRLLCTNDDEDDDWWKQRDSFGFDTTDGAAGHVYCHVFISMFTRLEKREASVLVKEVSNIIKATALKWMKLGCAVAAFPFSPSHHQLWVEAGRG